MFFLLGLAIGSFLNVLITRLKTDDSIFLDHSRCPHCHRRLFARDLIPLLSFVFLAGRCRFCRATISWQYPLVELATGLLFVGVISYSSLSFDIVFWLFFVASFVVVITFDIRYQLIPDVIVWPLCLGALAYKLLPLLNVWANSHLLAIAWQSLSNNILSAFITGGFILLLVILTKERAMGMGDVPIATLQGWLLGYPAGIIALGLSFVLGALVSSGLLISGKATMKTPIPFTPFLIAGLLAVHFFLP